MKKWIKMSLCMMIGFFCFSFQVKAMNVEARIQDQNYETFQEALEDVLTGDQKGPIYRGSKRSYIFNGGCYFRCRND